MPLPLLPRSLPAALYQFKGQIYFATLAATWYLLATFPSRQGGEIAH